MKKITIDGITYIPEDEKESLKYCPDWVIVRTYAAGVFLCKIKERRNTEATLLNSRRIWKWEGAYELTDLAVNGTCLPDNCKLSTEIPTREVFRIEEILPVTEKSFNSLSSVESWNYKDAH